MSPLDDLLDGLASARSSVFRLEGHQDYVEDDLWQAHLRGEPWTRSDDLASYCMLVSGIRTRGASWVRVRIVVDPWTPYTRWEIEEHFPHNLAAGEDIRLLRRQVPEFGEDFWLIDDERAWFLIYDESGSMTVAEAAGEDLAVLRSRRDDALARAEPLLAAT